MRNLKARTLWIICAVSFVLAIGLIYLCTIAKDNWTTFVIVLLAIDFIVLTFSLQAASFQTFKYKSKYVYKAKDYNGDYNNLKANLIKAEFKERIHPYGKSYLLITGDTAYKCSIITDFKKYFEPEENNEEGSPNKALEKCNHFIGFEIFESIDEDNLKKLPDFTIQGDRVYLTSFLYQDNNLFKCVNYEDPKEVFKEAYDFMLKTLGFNEIKEEKDEL